MTARAESAGSGLRSILIATVIAGALGYAIQLAVPALISDDGAYVTFTVYWSTLYLCVAALSGIQQEITRASHPASDEPPTAVLPQFTIIAAAAAVLVVALFGVAFGRQILPGPTALLTGALSVGVVGYVLVAVLSGVMYGLRLWAWVAWVTVLDAGLRTALVLFGLAVGWPSEAIALAISLPFGLAFLIVWFAVRSRVVGAFRLDVPLKRLLAHVSGTVVAAAAMGLIMNGMPMLLGITTNPSETATLAGLILAITVTRAPIVVPLLALQSYLIALLRGGGSVVRGRVLRALAIAAGAIVVLSLLAAWIGPWAIGFISAGRSDVDAVMMAAITAGAGLVAMMCITGPALLAASRHVPYVAGWIVAALLTIACLHAPGDLESRLALAMLAPPLVGLAVHAAAVWRRADATVSPDPQPMS